MSAFEQIQNRHGKLDILVNNAAANPYFGHVLDTDLRAFTKTVDVNIRVTSLCQWKQGSS